MTIYQPGIPTGTVKLNVDYQNVQNNFTQLDTTYGVDHVKYSVALQNGYHKIVHLIPNSTTATNPPNNYPPTNPGAVGTIGQLVCTQSNDGINPDEMLWWLSGGGKFVQMTSNFQPTISGNGATFLPGGLILNWGYDSTNATTVTETMTQTFPKNFFAAFAIYNRNSSNVDVVYCITAPVVGSTSTIQFRKTSSSTPIFWCAIGN